MTDHPEPDEAETLPGSFDALDSVLYYFDLYAQATSPSAQAHTFTALNNAISDLRSFHPLYDYETGTMPWNRE